MKKTIKIFLSIVVILAVIFIGLIFKITTNNANKSITSKKVTAEVIKLDGSKQQMNLKKQDITDFKVGDIVYSEYEDGVFNQGKVIGIAGDKLSVQDGNIKNGDEIVYTNDQLLGLTNEEVFGKNEHTVGLYETQEENSGTTNQETEQLFDESIEFIVSNPDGSIENIGVYLDENNGIIPALYIEDK